MAALSLDLLDIRGGSATSGCASFELLPELEVFVL